MNSKFVILASILIICAFIVEETSAQYYAGAAYSSYYPSSYYGAYGAYNGYAGSYYGYGYPSAYSYYGKRSAGFGPNQPTQQ
ncbi:unnamed protein product [Caenorhabditis angaria]|uniref:Uncharacterized protein n=1 Tax=Caenorhabditis angaria TaxID=860376 RepID=A0A9P1IXX5_9PELO|nr:unnamed protein product [Caenorhabditis angaria]